MSQVRILSRQNRSINVEKWRIILTDKCEDYGWNEIEIVEADYFTNSDGVLKFWNTGENHPRAMFSEGMWSGVKIQAPKETM